MFKKFFSCLGDANEAQQVDLSGQNRPEPITNKPLMPAESNIVGQDINFEIEDLQSHRLHKHFLQQAAFQSAGIAQKLFYEHTDAEVESKITTASPSKTQYYKQQLDEYTPQIVLENQNNLMPSPKQSQIQVTQMNYGFNPAQSHFISRNLTQDFSVPNQNDNHDSPQKHLLHFNDKQHSTHLGDSPSTKIITHGALQQKQISESIGKEPPVLGKDLKSSFSKSHKKTKNPLRQSEDFLHRQSMTEKKPKMAIKQKTFSNQGLESAIPSSILSRESISFGTGSLQKRSIGNSRQIPQGSFGLKNKTDSSLTGSNKRKTKKMSINIAPQYIIDQLDNIISEEENQQQDNQQSSDEKELMEQLKVLDFEEDGQQLDLGQYKSLNKRQTSKTETFQPLTTVNKRAPVKGFNHVFQQHHSPVKKDIQASSDKLSVLGSTTKLTHKKNSSHIPQINKQTRNNFLPNKHMTTTTSPNERVSLTKSASKGTKIPNYSSNTKPKQQFPLSNQKRLKSKTIDIQEEQNEEEEAKNQQLQQDQQMHPPHFELWQREFDIYLVDNKSSKEQLKIGLGGQSHFGKQNPHQQQLQ